MASVFCLIDLLFSVSCNDTKTYEELKSEEKVVIRRIIASKDIEVLSEFPASGVFGENQFVQLESGIYLNIVDSGNGVRATAGTTTVLVRTRGEIYDADTPYHFNTFANTAYPFEFLYGMAYYVVNEHAQSGDYYYLAFGMGLESILQYVGDSSVVKLIVPGYSEISQQPAGSTYQSANTNQYYPIYYDKVRYLFY
ncbi:MAG: DUF4827 domain-containing protein [Tannerella sp.]|jgi:hypothetical protein|nr:DUF4827 domain-containing protein [Tannerella sp.]